MAQRVRIPYRGRKSFVCHTTPHSDSTSRRVSYSVQVYCTTYIDKSKHIFSVFRKLSFASCHIVREGQDAPLQYV